MMLLRTAAFLAAAALAGPAAGQDFDLPGGFGTDPLPAESEAAKHFKVRAVASHSAVTPGQTFHAALVGELAEHWVYYSPDPGRFVLGGELKVRAEKLQVGQPLWPKDKPKTTDYGEGPVVNHVYTGRFAVYVPLTVPAETPPGDYEIQLTAGGQICLTTCINLDGPNERTASVKVAVAAEAAASADWTAELTDGLKSAVTAAELKRRHAAAQPPKPPAPPAGVAAEAAAYTIWAGLGLALLAGLTLNIMPCVLPIIPLRIYSLVNMAKASRRRFVTLGLAFAGGIVLFFVGLAGVNVVLKLLGMASLDLNAHFQVPWVRIAIAMVLLALSANLWGLFNVTVPSKVAGLDAGEKGQGHLPAAGMGLMMAVLSTPCSFWLMALALAWAQVQPLWLGTVAIVLIGVGMAAPHVALAAFPDLVKLLPGPGVWMEHFKKTMGFLLLPAVLWLLSSLSEGDAWPFWVAGFGVVLAFALWVWGAWVRYDAPLARKLVVRGPAAGLLVAAGLWMLPAPPAPLVRFEPFDAGRIDKARADGKVVVVKVTAAWCLECRVLDARVFNTAEIAREFDRRGIVALKADVTDRSRPASRWVEAHFGGPDGSGGQPPLTIIYPAGGGEPTAVPGVFSQAEFLEMLDRAKGS